MKPTADQKLTISDFLAIAEEQAKLERETPSPIDANSPDRNASWQNTLDLLKYMKEHGVPGSLADPEA